MLLIGDYHRQCKKCGAEMTFRLIYHTAKIKTEQYKKNHEVWERGRLK